MISMRPTPDAYAQSSSACVRLAVADPDVAYPPCCRLGLGRQRRRRRPTHKTEKFPSLHAHPRSAARSYRLSRVLESNFATATRGAGRCPGRVKVPLATMVTRADRPCADPRSSVPSFPGQETSLREPPTRQSSGRAEDRGAEPTSLAPPHSCREARKVKL